MAKKAVKPAVKFHRNGVAGCSFFTVAFTGRKGSGGEGKRLCAIRFCEELQEDPNLFCGNPMKFYAVIDLDDPTTKWDAAYFLDDIDAAIMASAGSGGSAYV